MFNIISTIGRVLICTEVGGLLISFAYGAYEDYNKDKGGDTYASASNVKAFLEYQKPLFEDNLKKIWTGVEYIAPQLHTFANTLGKEGKEVIEYIAPQLHTFANTLGKEGKEVIEYGITLYTRAIEYNSTKINEYYTWKASNNNIVQQNLLPGGNSSNNKVSTNTDKYLSDNGAFVKKINSYSENETFQAIQDERFFYNSAEIQKYHNLQQGNKIDTFSNFELLTELTKSFCAIKDIEYQKEFYKAQHYYNVYSDIVDASEFIAKDPDKKVVNLTFGEKAYLLFNTEDFLSIVVDMCKIQSELVDIIKDIDRTQVKSAVKGNCSSNEENNNNPLCSEFFKGVIEEAYDA